MPSNSTGSATDANVSKIAVSRVPADHVAPIPSIHTVAPRRTSLLLLSCCITRSDITGCRREEASKDPRDTIGMPDVRSASLPPDLYKTWARYARTDIT